MRRLFLQTEQRRLDEQLTTEKSSSPRPYEREFDLEANSEFFDTHEEESIIVVVSVYMLQYEHVWHNYYASTLIFLFNACSSGIGKRYVCMSKNKGGRGVHDHRTPISPRTPKDA